jgi:hypothetical protein
MTPAELVEQMRAASQALDAALRDLIDQSRKEAEADRHFRYAWSAGYLETSGTVAEREAETTILTEKERFELKLAEGLARSALEAVRSKRTQLSALQSAANAIREEAALARVGPGP